jgi:hypothetical protein
MVVNYQQGDLAPRQVGPMIWRLSSVYVDLEWDRAVRSAASGRCDATRC